ncbi:MAG: hypothetical protein K9L85_00600 [Candidatus Peribacteraceae bacterium]|nr:hypothetical protein [Candidatus Peribacteraceae bacterium]
MKSKRINFLENKKVQFAAILAIVLTLVIVGARLQSRELASDVALNTSAIATIQAEANKVKSARDEYFAAIGKGDGGAYDEYSEASDCPAYLDTRLTTLKNLRNDLQRLSGEIVMRERENETELPRGTIERELNEIEKEIRPALILNQLESLELELQKIETAIAEEKDSDYAAQIADSIDAIRAILEETVTTDGISEQLDLIESKSPYISVTASEITRTSVANIREIITASEESTIIRQITQVISQIAEGDKDMEAIEINLQRIESRIPNLPQSQQTVVQKSVDTIRKLLGRKSLAEVRENEIADLENQIQEITDEIFSPAELERINAEEQSKRIELQEATATLENCMAAKQDLEKCEGELRVWVTKKESYAAFITNLENTISAKNIELESKLTPLQKELNELKAEENGLNFSPDLSALMQSIEPSMLKADVASSFASGYQSGSSAVSGFSGALASANGYIQGAVGSVASALGMSASTVGGLTSSAVVFDGPGALTGLQTFKANYKGNSYGSAIGTITGWTNFVLPFVGVIAIAAIIYAGFLYLTAAGNEEQTKKAKNIIMWVVIGIILIFSAYAIVNSLLSTNSSSGGSGTSVGINIGGIGVNYSD